MSPTPPPLDLSKVRHELRTPINHILGYCDILLEDDSVPAAFLSDLQNIHSGGRQLLSLINHYFDEKTFATLKCDTHQLYHELRTPVNHIIGYSELLEEQAQESGGTAFIDDLRKIKGAAQTWLALMEQHLLPNAIHSTTGQRDSSFSIPNTPTANGGRAQTGSLLIVDDDPSNRDLLDRRLAKEGYVVTQAESGRRAIEILRERPFDLVLLDLIMPGLDGYQVLARLKADPELKHVPVIMISALDQESGITRCIEMGAEDYIAKPFNPVFLRARIGASLEKKRLRDQEQKTYRELVESQREIAANLTEAARYVESLLPARLSGSIATDYIFKPCSQLGGDIFGYHWIDGDHLAIYLLDVSGHGVGAALLSVSVMNVIRARTLGNIDFRRPAIVLSALNETFQMENHGNLYFTLWYGVYQKSTGEIRFASGGHPPALLVRGEKLFPLRTHSPALGCLPEYRATEASQKVERGDKLLVLSDGVYELQKPGGAACTFDDFEQLLISMQDKAPARILAAVQKIQASEIFEDDFSLLEITF